MTTMDAVPGLSMIFPAHNEEALIARALMEALAAQDAWPAPSEIIVACNGCTDRTTALARQYPVRLVEDPHAGMSFGNNLGARVAQQELLLFWDVDTRIAPPAFEDLAAAVRGRDESVGGIRALPDRVYPRSVFFYGLMNLYCRRHRLPPAGTVVASRSVYECVGGFDESIPQGTGSDFVRRGRQAGATFVWVQTDHCRTSVRRFEERGYLRQLLEWRRNIRAHGRGDKSDIEARPYDVIR